MSGLEVIGAIASAAGSLVSALGAMQQAKATQAAANYNAKIDERNAQLARNQAAVESEDKMRENRRKMATIHAAYGASGIDTAGAPLDVLQDTASEMALDAERIKYKGELRATSYQEDAQLQRMKADSAGKAGTISFFGGLFSAGASLAKGFA